MSTMQYLASDGEVDNRAIITDDLGFAKTSNLTYIDIFYNGKHLKTMKRLQDGSYSRDPLKW
jgi:hypothetical protein